MKQLGGLIRAAARMYLTNSSLVISHQGHPTAVEVCFAVVGEGILGFLSALFVESPPSSET